MAWYYYHAVATEGSVQKGWLQAPDAEAFYEGLTKEQLHCVHYRCYPDWIRAYKPQLTYKQLRLFAIQLGTMLESGITIRDALVLLATRASDRQMMTLLERLTERIDKGNTLSKALAEEGYVFPSFFRYMVVCGEESGRLEEVLAELAQYYEEKQLAKQQLRNALAYPLFLLVVGLVVVGVMLVYVVPMVTDTYAAYDTLPFLTSCMVRWSEWVRHGYVFPVVSGLFIGVGGVVWYLEKHYAYHLAALVYRMPLVKDVATLMVISQFTQVFEMLYRAGIPLVESLLYVSDVFPNAYIKGVFKHIAETVEQGNGLTEAMYMWRFFPETFLCMVRIGEASGKLEIILSKAQRYYKQALTDKLKSVVGLLEPMLIVVLGLGVGCIALGILQPMYQLMGTVG